MRYRDVEQAVFRSAGAVGFGLLGLRLPRLLGGEFERLSIFGDAVDGAQELAHCGDEGELGGFSGGPVALEAAMLLGLPRGLMIGVDTFTDAAFYARRPAAEVERRVLAFSADFSGAMAAMVRRITRAGLPTLAHEIAAAMASVDREPALDALRALLEGDIEARWPEVRCRVETINSAPLSRGASLVPGLQGLTVHALEDVGHFPMREDPAGLAALMRSIVERHGGIEPCSVKPTKRPSGSS